MKIFVLIFSLLFLAACVQVPEDDFRMPEPDDEVLVEKTEPNPLAPLPEEKQEAPKNESKMSTTSGTAPVPKAVPPPNSSTQQQASPQSNYAWTTESLSIEEGETKYVYVKEPPKP